MRLKWLWWLLGIITVLALLVSAAFWNTRRNMNVKRAEWKEKALQELRTLSATNEPFSSELEILKRGPVRAGQQSWVGENVLVMTNGDFLIFKFWHGANNGVVNHLFLARDSKERFYFSTYHFCSKLVSIMGEQPAGSIAEFTNRYALREFDGKSDVCLEKTWPLNSKP